jgi:hypothetical protein
MTACTISNWEKPKKWTGSHETQNDFRHRKIFETDPQRMIWQGLIQPVMRGRRKTSWSMEHG